MTTYSDLINDTVIALSGYTQRQDQATYLTEDINETTLTFTVADGSIISRGMIEIDDELMWVDKFDRTLNLVTLAPYGRGFRATTKAPHTSGTRVTVSPSFPRDVVAREINNAVNGVYPDLFGTYYTTFQFIASRNTYVLPSEAIDGLAVTWQTVGPTREWLPVLRWRVDKTANPGVFNTGKSISIYDGIIPGRLIQVVYKKVPSTLLLPYDDFSVTGLPDSAKEVIILGAAYRAASYLDVGRVPVQSTEVDQIDQQSPIGSGGTVTRALYALYQQRLNVEVRRQQEQFPIRVHRTR
jgi:hypothetical protein